eukprot:jgi/Picsp_1/562/NSC_00559-R1_protein
MEDSQHQMGADTGIEDSGNSHIWLLGVVINLVGSLSINLSTNFIKLAHTRNQKTQAESPDEPQPKLFSAPRKWWNYKGKGNRIWLVSITVFAVANIANFASFAFAAQSLLAALGSVQFISNVVFSKLVNKEAWNVWIVLGTVVIVAGCVLLVVFGSHESPTYTAEELIKLYSNPGYIIYLCVGGGAVVLTYLVYQLGKRRVKQVGAGESVGGAWYRWLPICYATFSALIGTQSVLFGKSMSLLLRTTLSGDSQAGSWYTWVVVVLFLCTAAFWMIRFNKALRLFPVSIIMPVLQVGWVILSMVSGSVYFQETADMGTVEKIMFGVGTVILIVGVWLITTSSASSDRRRTKSVKDHVECAEQDVDFEASRKKSNICPGARRSDSSESQDAMPERQVSVKRRVSRAFASIYGDISTAVDAIRNGDFDLTFVSPYAVPSAVCQGEERAQVSRRHTVGSISIQCSTGSIEPSNSHLQVCRSRTLPTRTSSKV